MWEWTINLIADSIPLILAVAGIIVSYNEIPEKKRPWATVALLALGFIGTYAVRDARSIADAHHAKELADQKQEHKQQLDTLEKTIQTNELRNAGDMGYLKAKLEDALAHPAKQFDVKEFATVVGQQIKEGIKTSSNKELADATLKFAQSMREFAADFRKKSDERSRQEWNERASKPATTDTSDWKKWRDLDSQARTQYDYQFKTQYLARAVYFRDELWYRLGINESQLAGTPQMANQLAFRGFLAGPTPVEDAASYLESLAHQLLATTSKQR